METVSGAARFAQAATGDGSGYGFSDGYGSGFDYGFGDGCGSGFGSGSGDGSGYVGGSGSGDGYGYGDGCGFGFGSGSGDGSGYGSGFDYGFGDGCGSGFGSGSGDGILRFCSEDVYMIDGVPTMLGIIYGNIARGRILLEDLTTKTCYVVKQGGVYAHGKTPREAMEALRDKLLEDMPEEERIAEFVKAHKWGKQYPSADYYGWHHRLTGSCDMGRSEFAKSHGYKLTADELLTVEEFIDLTKGSYGGDIIRRLREAYNKEET